MKRAFEEKSNDSSSCSPFKRRKKDGIVTTATEAESSSKSGEISYFKDKIGDSISVVFVLVTSWLLFLHY